MFTKVKCFFLLVGLSALALPCLGMNRGSIAQKEREWDLARPKITQDNFDAAMGIIRQRPEGQELADNLSLKLNKFVNQELSVQEWHEEVRAAYKEILDELSEPEASRMSAIHPFNSICVAALWAIPQL